MHRLIALLLAAFVAAAPGVARADHEDGFYELPALAMWDRSELDVIIVPPNHGQIYNQDKGLLNGNDPNELTPFNSYVKAVEASIEEWDRGIQRFGSESLKKTLVTNVYVLGRDNIPTNALLAPEIVVVTDENKTLVLGFALRADPCIVNNSKMLIYSFTYADMYNVNAQEYGHCLGLQHVGSQGSADPTSAQKHPEHDVMNGFYADDVGAAGTHLHCVSNLNVLGLEYVFSNLTASFADHVVYMPVNEYGTTCEPPAPVVIDPTSQITTPADGDTIDRADFERIAGVTNGQVSSVQIALARRAGSSCRWWDAETERLVRGSCDEPRWYDVSGTDKWEYELPQHLPRGAFRVYSRASDSESSYTEECCDRGRNEVRFRLA